MKNKVFNFLERFSSKALHISFAIMIVSIWVWQPLKDDGIGLFLIPYALATLCIVPTAIFFTINVIVTSKKPLKTSMIFIAIIGLIWLSSHTLSVIKNRNLDSEKLSIEKSDINLTTYMPQVEFISSINSKLYHTTDCRYAEQILSKNLSSHGSRADAEVLGKLPCDVCIYASPLVISAEELSEDVELTEKPWYPPIPHSGMRFVVPKDDCIVPFSVTTGSSNIVIYMRDLDRGKNNMAFMVRANDCIERNVPVGDYKVYYATGTDWYGEDLLFGEDTEYYSIKDTFYFYAEVDTTDTWRSGVIPETVRTYQIELLPEPGGMLEVSEISARLFPQFNKD